MVNTQLKIYQSYRVMQSDEKGTHIKLLDRFLNRILKDNLNDITLSLDICNNSNLYCYKVYLIEI